MPGLSRAGMAQHANIGWRFWRPSIEGIKGICFCWLVLLIFGRGGHAAPTLGSVMVSTTPPGTLGHHSNNGLGLNDDTQEQLPRAYHSKRRNDASVSIVASGTDFDNQLDEGGLGLLDSKSSLPLDEPLPNSYYKNGVFRGPEYVGAERAMNRNRADVEKKSLTPTPWTQNDATARSASERVDFDPIGRRPGQFKSRYRANLAQIQRQVSDGDMDVATDSGSGTIDNSKSLVVDKATSASDASPAYLKSFRGLAASRTRLTGDGKTPAQVKASSEEMATKVSDDESGTVDAQNGGRHDMGRREAAGRSKTAGSIAVTEAAVSASHSPVARPVVAQEVTGRNMADANGVASLSAMATDADLAIVSADAKGSGGLEELLVDFVFTWCGSKNISRSIEKLSPKEQRKLTPGSHANIRFEDAGELKFAFRSVARFAPWVRKVHLVISDDEKLPPWLDTSYEKVNIVRHSEIFDDPASELPTHNSYAIEACIHRIPGLAEHIVYFNDDMYLGARVTPLTFFTPAGRPKIWFWGPGRGAPTDSRADPYVSGIFIGPRRDHDDSYITALRNDNNLVVQKLGSGRLRHPEVSTRMLIHQAKPITVSWLRMCSDQFFADNYATTRRHSFRSVDDVFSLHLSSQMCVQTGDCEVSPEPSNIYFDVSRTHPSAIVAAVTNQQPTMFCTNDASSRDTATVTRALTQLFSRPSPFEGF